MRFIWESKWKASPDRRHQARGVFWINDDGHGLVQLEIRQTQSHILARTAPVLAFMTAEGFKRSAATLRWQSTATVTVVPWAGLFGDYAGLVELNTAAGIGAPGWLQPVVADGPPVKVTTTVQTDQDVARHPWLQLEVLQTSGIGTYGAEVERVAGLLARDEGFEAWWSSTPFDTLRLHVSVPDPRWPEVGFKPGLRKSGMDLVLKIAQSRSELPASTEQPALRERARADVYEALVATARARGFADPPPLPDRIAVNRKQWQAAKE